MIRKLLGATAAVAATLLPVAAFAGPSELQQGAFSVPYACSVAPANVSLSVGATNATGGATVAYSQNSETQYSLSPLALNGPLGVNNGAYTGTISFSDQSGALLVSNSSKTAGTSGGTQAALSSGNGSTGITMQTSESGWRAGNYSIASTLSCAQVL